jgi:hypothetical protein
MGDLIIKPESGGSIKLQNNAGTNALVSDNSGNITLVGNTTLSGTANNLGTVTTGTFPAPSATALYPAGHVLQVVSYFTDTQSNFNSSTSDQVVNGMSKVITPKGANSKFLVTVRWGGESVDSWDRVFNIQMDGTRVNSRTSGGTTLANWGLALTALSYHTTNDNSTPESLNFSILVSSSSVIGTDITFRLVCSGSAATAIYSNRCVAVSNEEFTSELIITEIKG